MKRLTVHGFDRARDFIFASARPLEQRLFAYHFESGSADDVKAELASFQNEDGGFGRGVEPDFRLAASSPLATTVAFQIFRDIGASSDDEAVGKGIGYLLSTYDSERREWPTTPRGVNDEPHAPWWHHDGDRGNALDRSGWGNPSAEIVGHLRDHAALVPHAFLAEVTELAMEDIRSLPDDIDSFTMLCYVRLADALADYDRELVRRKLEASTQLGISIDPDSWPGKEGSLLPFAPTPDSLLGDVLSATVAARLDGVIDGQADDGSWMPEWSWGQYEEAWQSARVEWQGHLTLLTLLTLRAYGRIEGI